MVFIPGTHFPNLFLPNQHPSTTPGAGNGVTEKMNDGGPAEQGVTFPSFSSLPLDPSGPRGNAWGLYPLTPSSSSTSSPPTTTTTVPKDQLGCLNLLTPQTTLAAAKEIQHGIRICTDWQLTRPKYACFGRRKFEHRIVNKGPRVVNDDVVEMNTQSGSQWDGFRHFGRFLRFLRFSACGESEMGREEVSEEKRVV